MEQRNSEAVGEITRERTLRVSSQKSPWGCYVNIVTTKTDLTVKTKGDTASDLVEVAEEMENTVASLLRRARLVREAAELLRTGNTPVANGHGNPSRETSDSGVTSDLSDTALNFMVLEDDPEPRTLIVDGDGEELVRVRGGVSGRARRIAERMVASWNACMGTSTQLLQEGRILRKVRDWRMEDGQEIDVPDDLRGDYTVQLSKGPYDNLELDLRTPRGVRTLLRLEAEQGHFKVFAYCPDAENPMDCHDDVDMIARLTDQGAVVYSNYGRTPGLLLDGDQVEHLDPQALQQLVSQLDGSAAPCQAEQNAYPEGE